ncbi:MAG: AraC family transcriptional regulator [Clostridia bacterium]
MDYCVEHETAHAALCVSQCGREQCMPGHQYGPAVRRCYLMHYITAGCGEYIVRGQCYALKAGQGFMIFPGDVTTYRANEETPWHYHWIGYDGRDAELLTRRVGLTRENPVFEVPQVAQMQAILDAAYEEIATLRLGDMGAVGSLLRFLARVGEVRGMRDEQVDVSSAAAYYEKAVWYIQANLARTIRVADVASFVGLCRSQLFRVFQATAHCAPQEWIQTTRLMRAEVLLLDRTLSLQEVARSVGYESTSQLCAVMRKMRDTSPSAYRKRYLK